jgi:hypothetical protein
MERKLPKTQISSKSFKKSEEEGGHEDPRRRRASEETRRTEATNNKNSKILKTPINKNKSSRRKFKKRRKSPSEGDPGESTRRTRRGNQSRSNPRRDKFFSPAPFACEGLDLDSNNGSHGTRFLGSTLSLTSQPQRKKNSESMEAFNHFYLKNKLLKNDFNIIESFIFKIKEVFGTLEISDDNRIKFHDFANLKLVLVCFLSNNLVDCKLWFNELKWFEHVVFRTFLVKGGYMVDVGDYPVQDYFDIKRFFDQVKSKFTKKLGENQMLALVLKSFFKIIIKEFYSLNQRHLSSSDIERVIFHPEEIEDFYDHHFWSLPEYQVDKTKFFLRRKVLDCRKGHLEEYISLIISSPVVVRSLRRRGLDLHKKINSIQGPNLNLGEFIKEYLEIEVHRVIDALLGNFEIILNQFNPHCEERRSLEWKARILRDVALEPQLHLPCNSLEFRDCLLLFENKFAFDSVIQTFSNRVERTFQNVDDEFSF